MTHDATRDSDLSRLRAWRPRPAEQEPAGEPDADADAVSALLGDLADLRLRLTADMGVLASAVELDAHDVAADVLDGQRADLAAFGARAAARVPAAEPDQQGVEPDVEQDGALPVPTLLGPASRRRRLLRRVPLGPALAAAAAAVGVLAGLAVTPHVRPPVDPVPVNAAGSSPTGEPAQRLEALQPRAAGTRLTASQLEIELARILVLAAEDPVAAQQALQRLADDVRAEDDPALLDDLRRVLATYSRALASLQSSLDGPDDLPLSLPPAVPTAPAPAAGSADERRTEPSGTGRAPEPAQPGPTSSPAPGRSEAPQPSPSPSPSSTPAAGPPLLPSGPTNGSRTVLPTQGPVG